MRRTAKFRRVAYLTDPSHSDGWIRVIRIGDAYRQRDFDFAARTGACCAEYVMHRSEQPSLAGL